MNLNIYENRATPEEFENIIKKYRNLDDYGKETIAITLERESERSKQQKLRLTAYEKALKELNLRRNG